MDNGNDKVKRSRNNKGDKHWRNMRVIDGGVSGADDGSADNGTDSEKNDKRDDGTNDRTNDGTNDGTNGCTTNGEDEVDESEEDEVDENGEIVTYSLNHIGHIKKRAFLKAYIECGGICRASASVGIDRKNHALWLEKDEEYAEAFECAKQLFCENLEREAIRRAKYGVTEPVFQKGMKVGTIQRYSDTLLIFLMKGYMPDKYRDNVNVSTNHNVDITLKSAMMTDQEKHDLIRRVATSMDIIEVQPSAIKGAE